MWSAAFDSVILLAILVNCIFMALNPPFEQLEASAESYFVVIFTLECALKIVSIGFLFHPHAYLRSGWNLLDFVVVVTGLAALIARTAAGPATSDNLSGLQALRAFRVLRPLRTISRVPGMRVLVHSLLDAVPQLAGVLLLFVFCLLIFGVVGIQVRTTPRMHTAHAHSACTQRMHTAHAHSACTQRMHTAHAHSTRTSWATVRPSVRTPRIGRGPDEPPPPPLCAWPPLAAAAVCAWPPLAAAVCAWPPLAAAVCAWPPLAAAVWLAAAAAVCA